MSAKRKADMDAIQSALQGGTTVPEDNPGTFLPSGPVADVIPIPPPPSAATDEQKEAAQAELDAAKLADKYQAEQLRLQKEQESLVKAQLRQTALVTKQALGSVQNGLGSVAMPGGLLLPLVVLGVFLMLLVKINGNTRLGWIWLVMSGNAEVGDPNSNGASGNFGNGTGGGNPNDNAGAAKGGGPPPVMYMPALPLEMDEW